MSLRQFLYLHNITITLTGCWYVPLCCEHGQYLIEPALSDRSFTYSDYEHISCVRMHLQVATLSDTSNGNGRTFNKAIMAGQRPTDRHSPRAWPRRPTVTNFQVNNNNSWMSRFNYYAEGAFISPAVIFELGSQDPISSRQNDRMYML